MSENSILTFNNKESASNVLNELLRNGARQLIHNSVVSELKEFILQHQQLDDQGKPCVVRNGYLPEREIQTGIDPVKVRIHKVR